MFSQYTNLGRCNISIFYRYIVYFKIQSAIRSMRTNTIFTTIYNGTNTYMDMSGRKHIVHINDKETDECYDLNI